ncbi:uncharacterized protein K460DRAFT_19537 [Cucurbitaria berberidis CBS 394.84]|uniref:Uncharacterized protein n=1 Tax=Cucurbitaria berberidis CBS 394.84 TaxID=1168544 RepID=A0A9P4LDS1_9PLEO|nr:uncharacterized protein K460DRAFT_19537 [Cucurbitaria berberidis CBS 394.84]KAF1850672.1 hypothetical protein K460DRAFT_19537 [Cucurbitaria berberidis CBS 394.84]
MASLPKNNAFGAGSPSWNLPFPDGNMTAAEILAYLPHWLKSIDVIDRLVANGGRSAIIAAMINEFRHQPTGEIFQANSVQIMMSYAMRRAGYTDWTVGTHELWKRESDSDEENLSVKDFRPPRLTHPKTVAKRNRQDLARNYEAEPIEFKDLALHVKKHPADADALDLTRCIQYALTHQHEKWLFPTDFKRLVIHLGGPAQIDHLHHDRQVFARRENLVTPAKPTPRKFNRTMKAEVTPRRRNKPPTHIEKALSLSQSGTTGSMTPRKRGSEDLGRILLGSQRRSGRLAGKAINLCEEDSDATDNDVFDSAYSGYSTPAKKRKISLTPPTPISPSNDSEFVQDDSEPDDDIAEAEDASEEDALSLSSGPRGRAAARKARQNIQSSFTSNRTPLILKVSKLAPSPEKKLRTPPPQKPVPTYIHTVVSPEVMEAVKQFAHRTPVLLQPPVLSANRLRVDAASIYLYASEGCSNPKEMWESALSCTRFGGPRRHAPFRELHRLTDPDMMDGSDWAENIRWAKEQNLAFGSKTWTEYDYHLEMITQARRETMWVSEELIRMGM